MTDDVTTSRYDASNKVWPATCPPINATEAARAAERLAKRYLPGRPLTAAAWKASPRRVWISPRATTTMDKGWRRLVHDVSHRVFQRLHPQYSPHDFRHAQLEADMVAYVLASGWLDGKLRPRKRATGKVVDPAAQKAAAIDARIKRWESKARRAENALKKLRRQARYYAGKATAEARPG